MVTVNDILVVRYTSCKRAAVSVVFATLQLSQVSFSATSAHRENLKTTAKDYRHMEAVIPAPSGPINRDHQVSDRVISCD
jgi:hypothetical protein